MVIHSLIFRKKRFSHVSFDNRRITNFQRLHKIFQSMFSSVSFENRQMIDFQNFHEKHSKHSGAMHFP